MSPASDRRSAVRNQSGLSEKFQFSHLDRSSDALAMKAAMEHYGITVPPEGEEIDI